MAHTRAHFAESTGSSWVVYFDAIWDNKKLEQNQDIEFIETQQDLLKIAIDYLPEIIDHNSWKLWTKKISEVSGKKGKELFMPLRRAITCQTYGPELKYLLQLISRQEIIKRLQKNIT